MVRSALIASALVLSACGEASVTDPEPAVFVEADGAFIVDPPAGRDVAAGGLVIQATGDAYDFVGVRTDSADRVEIHTMGMEDGVMRMRQVDRLAAEPGTPLVLERGGNHLMLFGFDDALQPGDSIELLLDFEGSDGETTTLNISADVRGLGDQ